MQKISILIEMNISVDEQTSFTNIILNRKWTNVNNDKLISKSLLSEKGLSVLCIYAQRLCNN